MGLERLLNRLVHLSPLGIPKCLKELRLVANLVAVFEYPDSFNTTITTSTVVWLEFIRVFWRFSSRQNLYQSLKRVALARFKSMYFWRSIIEEAVRRSTYFNILLAVQINITRRANS